MAIILIQSCNSSFDEIQAKKLVELSREDIKLYGEFNKMLQSDLQLIQKVNENKNSNPLLTNSYYLFQIDSFKYATIIEKLKKRKIYSDWIEINSNGMICFRIKEISNTKWNDFSDSYIHELVFNTNKIDIESNSDNIVFFDSNINNEIKYRFYKAKVGH